MEKRQYLIDPLSKNKRRILAGLIGLWLLQEVIFWYWWIHPEHVNDLRLFILNSTILLVVRLLPAYFFFFLLRMKTVNKDVVLTDNLRAAMVVTKAPSEPFSIVKETLLAMIKQTYPHDNWLADEDPTEEVIAWCREHGVKISTRKGIPEYNMDKWPRRKKCKEGNLAYFYDKYGYENYDFVCQFDADHIPQSDYLEVVLKAFMDDKVGYVSAPSICDKNASESWTARARLYLEASLHGAQQLGHANGFAPLCIGSHYSVRTSALKEIGGVGPELAEDHSTSLLMNAYGWKGVHAIDAIAHGDGPNTFADGMTQEFQWSRSLVNILFNWSPKVLSKLTFKLKLQFLFAQMWYPLFVMIMLSGIVIPVVAIMSGNVFARIPYVEFILMSLPALLICLIIVAFVKAQLLLRPYDAKLISWEGVLFQLARWPWILLGTVYAVYDTVKKEEFAFKVTPKVSVGEVPLPTKILMPYFALVLFTASVGIFFPVKGYVGGYLYFLLMNSVFYTLVFVSIIALHRYENK